MIPSKDTAVPRLAAGTLRLPRLGFGTWRLYGEHCTTVVADALAVGYRYIDTAARYGNEASVGEAIAAAAVDRDELIISTKLPLDCNRQMVFEKIRESLRLLRVEWIDLLLMHWPNPSIPTSETLSAMVAMRDQGLVRELGVSNFPPRILLEALQQAPLVTNQVEYHPYLNQDTLIRKMLRENIVLTAYSPLARGRVLEEPLLREIAAAHDKTISQVVLRWLIQQPMIAAIPKTGNARRLRENFAIFDFELTTDEMACIGGLADGIRIVDPPFAPDWGF